MAYDVNVTVEEGGSEVNIFADPDTLRAIAEDMEQRAIVTIEGQALDLNEPATIVFQRYIENNEV